MKHNRTIHFGIYFLLFFLLTSISSCGLIDLNGDDGDELTEHERYLLRIQAQLIGTWDIQFISIDELGYNSPLDKFSKTLKGRGYRIVFNADNTMRFYRDGYPANKAYYKVDDYAIICYTDDYYDMYIQYEIEYTQSGYLKEAKYSYRNGNSTMASGRITLQKISSEEEKELKPVLINPDNLLGTWTVTHEEGNELTNGIIDKWNVDYNVDKSYLSLTFNVDETVLFTFHDYQEEDLCKYSYKDGVLKFTQENDPTNILTWTLLKMTSKEFVVSQKRDWYYDEITFTKVR